MADQLIQLDARKPSTRILMVLTLVLALVWSWFAVRWYIGDLMAEYFNPEEDNVQNVLRAVSLAPNDPLAHWRLGEFIQKKLPPDQLARAITEYETAVNLSPNDYRFWISLGSALEHDGDNERAEKALRRSVELAPSYSYPAWFLGNLLLREGRTEEAFTELRRASDSNPELRPQLFNLAWELYSSDFQALKTAIGPSADARAQFSQYLFSRNRPEDGLAVWNSLTETDKKANRDAGKSILAALIAGKHFQKAIAISNDLSPSVTYRAELGKILNGGFENDFPRDTEAVFDWQVKTVPQVQIGIDPNTSHSGSRSLRLLFQVRSHLDAINVSQFIAVPAPGATYNFECYVKTHNLQSAATPLIQIVNATDDSVLATSNSAPIGTNDWQRVALTFKTDEKSEAVIVRIGRSPCDDNSVCPIFGTVWYDDFNLSR